MIAERLDIDALNSLDALIAAFNTVAEASATTPPTSNLTLPAALDADLPIGSIPSLAALLPFVARLPNSSFAALISRVSTSILILAKSMFFFDLYVTKC